MSTDAATRTRWVHVDGRSVRVLERGTGPAVVLIHGLGLSAGVWKPHLPRLAGVGYRVLAPDLPGFGHSGGRLTGFSIEDSAVWLEKLAAALDIHRAAWVGHSLGAQQVARLAVTAPERVAALVLAAPTGRTGRHVLRQTGGLLATAFQERPGLILDVVRRYLRRPVTTIATWIRALGHRLTIEAPLISCPTLLVVGERDAVVPGGFISQLEQLVPDVETRAVEDASHAVAIDAVAPFLDAITAFLDRRYSGVSTD